MQYLIAGVGGAGIWQLVSLALEWRRQKSHDEQTDIQLSRSLRDELRGDLLDLRQRVQWLEQQAEEERAARLRAEQEALRLQYKLDVVISMLNSLREQNGMQPIDANAIPAMLG